MFVLFMTLLLVNHNYKNYMPKNNYKRKLSTNSTNHNYPKYDETQLRESTSFEDISNLIDKDEWMEAINEELTSMTNLKVYEIIKDILMPVLLQHDGYLNTKGILMVIVTNGGVRQLKFSIKILFTLKLLNK